MREVKNVVQVRQSKQSYKHMYIKKIINHQRHIYMWLCVCEQCQATDSENQILKTKYIKIIYKIQLGK